LEDIVINYTFWKLDLQGFAAEIFAGIESHLFTRQSIPAITGSTITYQFNDFIQLERSKFDIGSAISQLQYRFLLQLKQRTDRIWFIVPYRIGTIRIPIGYIANQFGIRRSSSELGNYDLVHTMIYIHVIDNNYPNRPKIYSNRHIYN